MTDQVDHTKRYLYMHKEVGSLKDLPDLAAGLYNAWQIEHDWVIRLDSRLEWANAQIASLKEQLRDEQAESSRLMVELDEATRTTTTGRVTLNIQDIDAVRQALEEQIP